MESIPDASWEEGLKLVSYCPLCKKHYTSAQARLLEANEASRLLHVRCNYCSNAILALILIDQSGTSSVGFVTDLTYDDAVQFLSCDTVSVDDVIATHRWVNAGQWTAHVRAWTRT